ncbi:hypothetical protein N0O92_12170 [Alkalihalobacillus sp. MEB130]|uniref:HNH endonuclease n=1 Tax=Alkalihalobacillus sp. MEB130 TaxID=2976704 RepID=UPI0028DF1901|nr:hypothetical protein [Alkalihalobacillus sp. MEB130]MDT8860989.1 hypothetical protein [Alkalihalobacillus sp. MEB130]
MTFYNLTLLSFPTPIMKYKEISKSKYKYKEILYGTDALKSRTYNIINECYNVYESNKDHLENINAYPDFETSEKEALLHCYTGNTKLVRELKTAIISQQNVFYRNNCAYCGLNETKYMDHYLPKDIFPEYAIHYYNLVPCCSYCNEKKSGYVIDENRNRKVYNPYFENVGEQLILECKLQCEENTISTRLVIKEDVENQVYKNHVVTLGLIERYEEQIPRKLATIIFELIVGYEENGIDTAGAKRVMNRKLSEAERLQGYNSLDALIYRAYLKSDSLFNVGYLKSVYFKLTTQSA